MYYLELLRKIKERPEWKEVGVILCTSVKDRKAVQQAAELGCDDYMTKPIDLDKLLWKIKNRFKREQPVIQDKNRIRLRLFLTYDGYKELDAMFSTLVLEKIGMLEDHAQRGYPEDITDSILQLQEGAVLLGAERLQTKLRRLKRKKEAGNQKAIKEEYPRVHRELQSLKDHLLTKPLVTVRYELPENARVLLFVTDQAGQKVRHLIDEDRDEGIYETSWNGCDDAGARLMPGYYTIHLEAGSNVQQRGFKLD